jgi:NAD(P)-dependent dehydrogenase (short-subunit alcohol dehydrogenase family)
MKQFSLEGRAVVITGGAGLLGQQHAIGIAEAGGLPIILDNSDTALANALESIKSLGLRVEGFQLDASNKEQLDSVAESIKQKHGLVSGLVNNLSANPPPGQALGPHSLFESYPMDLWDRDLRLGLTAAFVNSQVFGNHMVQLGKGSIVNVGSDLAVIAPDQRIYQDVENPTARYSRKPVSYSVVKAGLLGLTKYLSTYWSPLPIRSNALLPGSVRSNQSPTLIKELEDRIPLGRLAEQHEYKGALVFLLADASSYMTGSNLTIDGGRSAW